MRDINFDCELPPVVEAIRQGWLAVCQSAAIIASILAAVAAQILVSIKRQRWDDVNPAAVVALIVISYASIIFNTSAAISSVILIDTLGDIPVSASKDANLLKRVDSGEKGVQRTTSASALYLLKQYGAGRMWTWMMWHWCISLHAGIWCLMAQILLSVFLQESTEVKIALTCIVSLALLSLAPYYVRSRK